MYSVLEEENFKYDCTWPTRYEYWVMIQIFNLSKRRFGYMDAEQGLYPYTLDYRSVQVSLKPTFHQILG